jgi:hypothetical protein
MVSNGGAESQTGTASLRLSAYTDAWCTGAVITLSGEKCQMVERRIKPYQEQVAQQQRREEQRRSFLRNQTFGLIIVASVILAWWLFHTNPRWIFPPGWWRP